MSAKIISNIEQLAEAIGSYIGMMQGLEQQTYLDKLITKAHSDAVPVFNKAVAAKAMGKNAGLSHAWEFGTAGITRGRVKYPNPLSPNAQLWVHTLKGEGPNKTIGYVFRPAKSQVPPHDPEEIGVAKRDIPPLKVMTGMRRYYFPNKASIFESGKTITVKTRRSKFLFIPTKTEGLPSTYTGDPDKGYVWAKSHTYSPGDYADSTGRFTAFFGGWWKTAGAELMQANMSAQVETDLIEVDGSIRTSKKMTPVQAQNIKAAAKRGQVKTRKQWTIKTREEITDKARAIL